MESDFSALVEELREIYGDDILFVIRNYLEGLKSEDKTTTNPDDLSCSS